MAASCCTASGCGSQSKAQVEKFLHSVQSTSAVKQEVEQVSRGGIRLWESRLHTKDHCLRYEGSDAGFHCQILRLLLSCSTFTQRRTSSRICCGLASFHWFKVHVAGTRERSLSKIISLCRVRVLIRACAASSG